MNTKAQHEPEVQAAMPPRANMAIFAQTVLATAAQVEAAERTVKEAILAAAQAGDSAKVVWIISRWMTMAAGDVLAEPKPASPRTPRASRKPERNGTDRLAEAPTAEVSVIDAQRSPEAA